MNTAIFICAGFEIPTDTHECREVIWSSGTSCRKCPLKTCYRNGWLKPAVTKDNKRIVANKRKQVVIR